MRGQLLEHANILVGIPTIGHPDSDFALCLAMMAHDLSFPLQMVKKHTFSIMFERGSMVVQQRENLVQRAKKLRATHLLFIDDDMTFPQQVARVLLSRRVSIIAANCVTKTFPAVATARTRDDGAGKPIYISASPSEPCRAAWRVGTGIMMIDMQVFDRLGDPPYFGTRWDSERNRHVYEDWIFLEKCEEVGITPYIDQQLSPMVGHVGRHTFSYADQEPEGGGVAAEVGEDDLCLGTR